MNNDYQLSRFFTVDAHEDIAFHLIHNNRDFVNPEVPCMITLPWLKDAGVRVVLNTVFIHPKHKPTRTVENAMLQLDTYDRLYRDHSEDIFQIKSRDDLKKLDNSKKIGFLTLMEGADPLRTPDDLYEYYQRGVRVLGPSWNNKNIFASGLESSDGLTDKGRRLIKKMNELSVTLDLSHLNEKCFWEAIELTELTPVASHSNAKMLTEHPRNLDDQQLKSISERGGVTGIVFYNDFLKTNNKPPTLEDIYKHTDYILNVCGEDHVGIGTDLDGARIKDFPKEVRRISSLPAVAEYFLAKGYTEELVSKIMGKNFLRVIENNLK